MVQSTQKLTIRKTSKSHLPFGGDAGDEINPHVFPHFPRQLQGAQQGQRKGPMQWLQTGQGYLCFGCPGWLEGRQRLGGFFSQWTYIMGM